MINHVDVSSCGNPLKVLSDSNSFLNQMVEILGEVRGKAFGLEDSQDFISSHKTDLGHPV